MVTLAIRNGTVLTLGTPARVLPAHDVLCTDGVITGVVPTGTDSPRADRELDARGRIVMPGFINAHMHFYSTFARGLGAARPAHDFNGVLRELWWRLDRQLELEDCYWSTLPVLLDAIRHGATTLIDHHASPGAVAGSLDAVARAVEQTGVRACLCYEVSDRDGAAVAAAGLAENERFLRRCRAEPDALLRGLFGLHASFTLGDATLERAAEGAAALDAGCHVHVAEAASDQEATLARHGVRVVERLTKAGVLGPRSIAAHCVHVDADEMDLLAASGTAVAHNPQSNMNNGVGIADLVGLMAHGVLVGLGTDAMTVDMREEVRAALWAQRLRHGDPAVGFDEATGALLEGNARIAGRLWETPLGVVAAGAAADLVVLDYDPPTPLDDGSVLGHLVFGLGLATVSSTVVAGRILMEERRLLLDLDEAEVAAKARERAAALWRRF